MLHSVSAAFAAVRRLSTRPSRPESRLDQTQFRALLCSFAMLGGHVGAWAVLLAALTRFHSISPGLLGQVLATTAIAGAVSSFVGGRLSDRLGRRALLILGMAGVGVAFLGFAAAPSREWVIVAFLVAGFAGGFFDLSLNSLGGDYERQYDRSVMSGLHAGFSAGAAITAVLTGVALATGIPFQLIYVVSGLLLIGFAGWFGAAPLPAHLAAAPSRHAATARRPGLWTRGLIVAMALIGLTFMQDAIIEGFSAVYLQDSLDAGALLLGGGIAATHAAVLTGRLLSAVTVRRFGNRWVLVAAGLGAAVGLSLVVAAASPRGAVIGFVMVGIAVAPIAPLAFSLAARSSPGRVGEAVSAVSIVAYGAFIVGPLLAGTLADAASLRLALLPFVATSLLLSLVAAAGLPRGT